MSSGMVMTIQMTLNHLAKPAKGLSCVVKHVRDMTRTYSQIQHTDNYSQHSSIFWPVRLNGWVFIYELSGCGFESSRSHLISDLPPALSKEFLDIQGTIECGFTLKHVRDMTRTYSQLWQFA